MTTGFERPPWWAIVLTTICLAILGVGLPLVANRQSEPLSQAEQNRLDEALSQNEVPAETTALAVDLTNVDDVLFIGDSWTYGLFAEPNTEGYAYVAGQQLDARTDVFGYPGVGYVTTGADGEGTLQQRWAEEAPPADPDLIVLQGSQNDAGVPPEEITAAASLFAVALLQQFSNAQLVMLGPAPVTRALQFSLQAIDEALTTAAAEHRVPYVSSLREGWLTPENWAEYVTPKDPHPNNAGHAYLADRLVGALQKLAPSGA